MPRTLVLAALLVGCSEAKPASPLGPPEDAGGERTPGLCAGETRASAFAPDLKIVGKDKKFTIRILSSTLGTLVRGENKLTVEVLDASDKKVSDASLAVSAEAVDLQEQAPGVPEVTPVAGLSQYSVSKLALPTSGVWKITFQIRRATEADEASVLFCVEG